MTKARTTMPLSGFTRDPAGVIARIKETGIAAVLTADGRPPVVMVDAEDRAGRPFVRASFPCEKLLALRGGGP